MLSIQGIARVCHEANRGYCISMGDKSQLPWDEAPAWQRGSAVQGVKFGTDLNRPLCPLDAVKTGHCPPTNYSRLRTPFVHVWKLFVNQRGAHSGFVRAESRGRP